MGKMNHKEGPVHDTDEARTTSVPSKHLTPCRQVGLRRKFGSAKSDETSASKRMCFTSPSFGTPKGVTRLHMRKRLLSPRESDDSECGSTKHEMERESTEVRNESAQADASSEYGSIKNNAERKLCVETKQSGFSFDIESIKTVSSANGVLEDIKKRIEAKEKLKSSLQQRLYKMKKGNEHVSRLTVLQAEWKEACQEALRDLLDKTNMQGQFLTMKQLMEKLGISNELLPYNSDDEEFGDNYP